MIALTTFAIMAALIFARLPRYGLWDDEANTALFARGVWRTGDTSGDLPPNIVAYRDGLELDHALRNRVVAPLPYFVASVFVRDTTSALAARLPFALAGLAAIGFWLWWLGRTGASRTTWALSVLALVGNVSLVLYCRQARYYALAILLATAITYVYAQRERTRWAVGWLSALGAVLFATHYLAYAGVAVALGCDYLVFGRKTARLAPRQLAIIVGTQVAVAVPIVLTWLPFAMTHQHAAKGLGDHLHLWILALRELNDCELGAGLVMLAAPLLYRRSGDVLLLRLPLAIVIASAVVTVFSPQPGELVLSDIRYYAFLIPACMLLGVRVLEALKLPWAPTLLAGLLVFQTTLVHRALAWFVPASPYVVPVRNTLAAYLGELADPPPSAYRLAADWLAANAHAGDSALVLPDYAAYPLMFHVPDVVYAWQLTEARAAAYPGLAPIHTRGKVAPTWVVAFAALDGTPEAAMLAALGARYRRAAALPVSGVDLSRPELVQHRFDAEAAYYPPSPLTIWRRIDVP